MQARGHDVAVRVRDAPQLAVWRVAAVERDAGDDDGLPGLGARLHAVDVVAVADAQRRLRGAERYLDTRPEVADNASNMRAPRSVGTSP